MSGFYGLPCFTHNQCTATLSISINQNSGAFSVRIRCLPFYPPLSSPWLIWQYTDTAYCSIQFSSAHTSFQCTAFSSREVAAGCTWKANPPSLLPVWTSPCNESYHAWFIALKQLHHCGHHSASPLAIPWDWLFVIITRKIFATLSLTNSFTGEYLYRNESWQKNNTLYCTEIPLCNLSLHAELCLWKPVIFNLQFFLCIKRQLSVGMAHKIKTVTNL